MQELMNEEIAKGIPPLYATEGETDPTVHAHFFSRLNGWGWYLVEYDPETGEAFGLVAGFETEWGYFSIREMEAVNAAKGFAAIERDEHFKRTPASRLGR